MFPSAANGSGCCMKCYLKAPRFALLLKENSNFAAAGAELHDKLETAAQAIGRQYFVVRAARKQN